MSAAVGLEDDESWKWFCSLCRKLIRLHKSGGFNYESEYENNFPSFYLVGVLY